MSGLILLQVVRESAVGEVPGKAHFCHLSNLGALRCGHSTKLLQHVVGDHAVYGEKGVLFDPRALFVGIATGHAGVALVEPHDAAGVAHHNLQFKRLPVRAQDVALYQQIRELPIIRDHSDGAPTPLLG